jgi:hypothetical protein
MKQITLIVDDKVGALADLSYVLGKSHINIESVSAEAHGGKAVINLLLDDERKAQSILKANGYKILSSEMMVIKIRDEPGTLSDVSQRLKDAGVNIESLFLLSRGDGYSLDALKVDKPILAKKALERYLLKAD